MNSPKGKNSLRSRIDELISKELVRLMGFIFEYDTETGYNISFFKDVLRLDLENFPDSESFIDAAKKSLSEMKDDFLSLRVLLETQGETELQDVYPYFLENFNKIEIFFELLELYLPIETAKIKKFIPEKDEIFRYKNAQQLLGEIEEKEEKIFGKKLSQRSSYAQKVLSHIRQLQKDNSQNLDDNDIEFLETILSQTEEIIWEQTDSVLEDVTNPNQNSHDAIIKDPLFGIESLDSSILSKNISRENYARIFELAISILGLKIRVDLLDNITNISVTPDSIKIPNSAEYDTLTVKRIIELISHELERHAIGNANNDTLIGNLKSLSYLGQEEGVADIMQNLAMGKSLDDVTLNRYMPRMLIGELFDGETFKRFLGIMNSLDGEKLNVENFFARFKRGRIQELPGVNPKEKLYGIGALEIIDRLREGENPLGFFLAKNGTSEQDIITGVVEGEGGVLSPEVINDKGLMLPLLLGELLRFKLIAPNLEGNGLGLSGFLKYFHLRYGELFNRLGLTYKDMITQYIKENKGENQRKVQEILEIMKA